MTVTAQPLNATATLASDEPLGSLGGGYFITYNAATKVVSMRHLDTPGTVTDSTTLSFSLVFPLVNMSCWGAQNVGDVVFSIGGSTNPAPYDLLRFTRSGTNLILTTVGTVTRLGYEWAYVSNDGTAVGLLTTSDFYVYSSSGTSLWSISIAGLGAGSFRGLVTPDRFLFDSTGSNQYWLVDDTGTTLATESRDVISNTTEYCGYGLTYVLLTHGDGAGDFTYNLLDTAGDVLTWYHATSPVLTPDFDALPAVVASWRTLFIAARTAGGYPTPSASDLLWVNPLTMEWDAINSSEFPYGGGHLLMSGEGAAVMQPAGPAGASDWSTWGAWIATVRGRLRQRQTPAPSRARGIQNPVLRQRQRLT